LPKITLSQIADFKQKIQAPNKKAIQQLLEDLRNLINKHVTTFGSNPNFSDVIVYFQ